jgi:hypothetical protein
MTQSDDASAIAYREHRIPELRAIWHSAEIVLCAILRNPLNCAPNVLDYRASGSSVGSPAGPMLERCNVSFRNANELAASARNAIEEAYDRREFRRTGSHSELIRLSRTLTDLHRLWGWWALSAGNIPVTRKHALRAFGRRPLSCQNLLPLACAMRMKLKNRRNIHRPSRSTQISLGSKPS